MEPEPVGDGSESQTQGNAAGREAPQYDATGQRIDYWNDSYWEGSGLSAEEIAYYRADFDNDRRLDAIKNREWRLKNIERDIERAGQSDAPDETHPPPSAATVPTPTVASDSHLGAMNLLTLVIALPIRFIFALISFTFGGLIGWAGVVLVLLKIIGVIHWQWWVVTLPLAYGVIYCLYMTIDGALYRAGLKRIGRYARLTQSSFTERID